MNVVHGKGGRASYMNVVHWPLQAEDVDDSGVEFAIDYGGSWVAKR